MGKISETLQNGFLDNMLLEASVLNLAQQVFIKQVFSTLVLAQQVFLMQV